MAEDFERGPSLRREVEDGPTLGGGTIGSPIRGKVVAQTRKRGLRHTVAVQVAQYALVTASEVLIDLQGAQRILFFSVAPGRRVGEINRNQ